MIKLTTFLILINLLQFVIPTPLMSRFWTSCIEQFSIKIESVGKLLRNRDWWIKRNRQTE